MELAVIAWFFFAIATAVIGTTRVNGGGCGWLIVGFLLGPIGLIFSLILKSDEQASEAKAEKRGNSKYHMKCPYCAEVIKKEAIKCRFCGSDLNSDGDDSLSPDQNNPGMP